MGLGGVLLAACSAGSDSGDSTTASATGDGFATETAGPHPGDGSNGPDVLEESGIERSDFTTSIDGGDAVEGVAMTLTMAILDITDATLESDGIVSDSHREQMAAVIRSANRGYPVTIEVPIGLDTANEGGGPGGTLPDA